MTERGIIYTSELYRDCKKRFGVPQIVVDHLHHRQDLSGLLHKAAHELEYDGHICRETQDRIAEEIGREKVRMELLTAALAAKDRVQAARAEQLEWLKRKIDKGEVKLG